MTLKKLRPIRLAKQEEAMRAKGYVRRGKRWMTVTAAAMLLARQARARRK